MTRILLLLLVFLVAFVSQACPDNCNTCLINTCYSCNSNYYLQYSSCQKLSISVSTDAKIGIILGATAVLFMIVAVCVHRKCRRTTDSNEPNK